MKALYKNLALITSLLFTMSIIGLAYYMFIFPERIANQTHLISLMEVSELKPVLEELYIFSAISILLGFVSILLHLFNRSSKDESNVVYIEKFKDKKESKNAQSKEEGDENIDENLKEINASLKKESDNKAKAEKLLSFLADQMEASQGAIYVTDKDDKKNIIKLFAAYAFVLPESQTVSYEFGEGLAGQVAKEQKLINISDIPKGYIKILSGLGEANPAHLILCPIMKDKKLLGVAEIASFKSFTKSHETLVEKALALISNDLDRGPEKVKEKK
ncbi:GAF domain-containing protein [uncultured Marivirga sp.]|uniref:GAF domain-containing protein n=1 Tax=uncultured Marivirga sp. TaxID=1123707 RepID=UPI0030EF4D60|tara:strand:+ start:191990 stop:192814 length:825 start_codon:yes stop_codon:yes gene_type:complete